MDLREYARAKFELAAILRSAAFGLSTEQHEIARTFSSLFARLAEDRFNVVVVGRFSRGKTSLMNAMLRTERLPVGVVPVTSVITAVTYGSNEEAIIEYRARKLPDRVPLNALAEYVSQRGNPGNVRGVSLARVQVSAELLRHGFQFIDTPGIGSSVIENTTTTKAFLTEADAIMLVTSCDSPLSEEELRVLDWTASSGLQLFLVVNKLDTISPEQRREVLTYVEERSFRALGLAPQVFLVSARLALDSCRASSKAALCIESGVPALEDRLTRFLLNEKQTSFFSRMCDRVALALREVGNPTVERDRLELLRRRIAPGRPGASEVRKPSPVDYPVKEAAPRFASCSVCGQIERSVYAFLCKYQYDLVASEEVRATRADHGGLCDFHTWQYGDLASPRGTCIGFPPVLERIADRLRDLACGGNANLAEEVASLRPSTFCEGCMVQNEAEQTAIAEVVRRINEVAGRYGEQGLCLKHLACVVTTMDREAAVPLLTAQVATLERVSEDMHRYVVKCDATRRFLLSAEEEGADRRALTLLAGNRNVCGRPR